ncbi:MAG: DoxX family protein [Bacteroidales bacterium]|jgi:uncharacterized membrane protein YphA (DoxX/SURF4 family)|nr:DoxX family protein [Bacteroidales bacterium]
MRIAERISRVVVGLVFIFSGFVKAVDPLGSAYKFDDYFSAFNLGFLELAALPLAILLCTAEFVAGVSVLAGIRLRTGIWAVILMMAVFTPLTLVLALTNPVSDCGCFGDAVHLTNWQTFGKNVIILAFALFLFARRKAYNEYTGRRSGILALLAAGTALVLFSAYNLRYLPMIDFLPYKKGTVIADKMVIPDGAPVDEYNTTFIYQKDGVQKEFTLENYPADDSTWVFVDAKSILVKKGYVPPIHDFAITDPGGNDITSGILANQGFTLLMISTRLEKADPERLQKGFVTGLASRKAGIDFYVVSASNREMTGSYPSDLVICSADEITLKTIVRSNPGYLLIHNGTIVGKWSWASLPGIDKLEGIMRRLTAFNS